jgi:16S rRNA (adenine1518-N6/adenine1519-N6)-dimethyltransferase
MQHQFKKKFGQNFIRDKNLLKKIVESAQIQNKAVIEIGPGEGALTQFLVLQAKSLTAYEIDTNLVEKLQNIKQHHNNFEFFIKDFLQTDVTQFDGQIHVVGNIPYNITSPIIFHLLPHVHVKSMTFMVQKEVAKRIASQPSNKTYNALSVILQSQYDIQYVMTVSKKMFYPIPKIDSAVIRLVRKEVDLEGSYFEFVKSCFKQKRKTLSNNLIEITKLSKIEIEEALARLNFQPNIRAENISVNAFKQLYESFKIHLN